MLWLITDFYNFEKIVLWIEDNIVHIKEEFYKYIILYHKFQKRQALRFCTVYFHLHLICLWFPILLFNKCSIIFQIQTCMLLQTTILQSGFVLEKYRKYILSIFAHITHPAIRSINRKRYCRQIKNKFSICTIF